MKVIASAVLALSLYTGTAFSDCEAGAFQELLNRSANQSPKIFQATPDGLKKLLEYINHNRSKMGKEPVNADGFFVAYFSDGVGITLTQGECLVPGMTFRADADTMRVVLENAKMVPADLVPFKGGRAS